MDPVSRMSEVLTLLESEKTASIQYLSETIGVSQETIRRDVKIMEEMGYVQKYHGGVRLPDNIFEAPFRQRQHQEAIAKEKIGIKAAQLVANNQSVMIESSTTALWVVRNLIHQRNLSIITNGLDVAREMTGRNNNRVYLAGGELSDVTLSTLDQTTINYIEQFTPDIVIIGASSLHEELGLCNADFAEAQITKAMIKNAGKVIVVADSTKFNRRALTQVCALNQIHTLVTDSAPEGKLKNALSNVEIIIA